MRLGISDGIGQNILISVSALDVFVEESLFHSHGFLQILDLEKRNGGSKTDTGSLEETGDDITESDLFGSVKFIHTQHYILNNPLLLFE